MERMEKNRYIMNHDFVRYGLITCEEKSFDFFMNKYRTDPYFHMVVDKYLRMVRDDDKL